MKIIRRLQVAAFTLAVGCFLVGGVYTQPSSAARDVDVVTNMTQMQQVDTTVSLNTVVKLINTAGLAGTLKGTGPYTVFAPTDAAFNNLPAGKLDSLQQNTEQLKHVLLNHVVKGSLAMADISKMKNLTSLDGGTLTFQNLGQYGPTLSGAKIIRSDPVLANNGVLYVIDKVLLPKGM